VSSSKQFRTMLIQRPDDGKYDVDPMAVATAIDTLFGISNGEPGDLYERLYKAILEWHRRARLSF
jgi:hypothetical protein